VEVAIRWGRPVRDLLGLRAAAARVDEMVFAGWLRGSGVPWCRARPSHRRAPPSRDRAGGLGRSGPSGRLEGPFGGPHGYYSLAATTPCSAQGDHAPEEPDLPDHHRGAPAAGGLLARQAPSASPADHRMMLPRVVDMNMPAEGVFHNLVIVLDQKRYPGHARKVMYALWGLGS